MADLDPAAAAAPGDASSQVQKSPPALVAGGPDEPASNATAASFAAPVSEKQKSVRERLLSLADAENRVARRMADIQNDFSLRGELLGVAMPQCYLKLVAGLRSALREFNSQLVDLPEYPLTKLNFYESPAVALNDVTAGDGMRVRVSRKNSYFDLMLRLIARSGKSDIPLIEGYGSIGRDLIRTETLLRIEGWVEKGEVMFWVNIDFKRRQIPLEEIPDRIVMAVASHDYSMLTRSFNEVVKLPEIDDEPFPEHPIVEPESPLGLPQDRQPNSG